MRAKIIKVEKPEEIVKKGARFFIDSAAPSNYYNYTFTCLDGFTYTISAAQHCYNSARETRAELLSSLIEKVLTGTHPIKKN